MTKHRFLLLGAGALAFLTLGGCGQNRDLAYAKVQIGELERQNADLEAQLADKNAELDRLRAGGQPAAPIARGTEDGIPGVEQGNRDKEHYFAVESDLLFRPGSAILSEKAKSTLNQVIAKIKSQYGKDDIRVEGHTDSDPISRSKDKWEDNWDLSGGRARAVLHYLIDHGVSAKQMGFAGYADERPRGSDKTHNRRVEIVAIPK